MGSKAITKEEFNETRKKLINAAANGNTIVYNALKIREDSKQHSHLIKVIEAISLFEYKKNNRPLLCAIVVSDNENAEPGSGFQKFCEKHGIDTDFDSHQRECFAKWGDEDFKIEHENV